MTFVRVMVYQGMDEHGPLYARAAGGVNGNVWEKTWESRGKSPR